MTESKEFDVVVFGATGFTGRLIADHLLERYGANGAVKWAMAGRSHEKLKSVRAEIGGAEDIELIVADTDDLASLKAMAERAKAVVTSVGPYQLYGAKLVQACAETGTDYLDLAGEPHWIRDMIDQFEGTAKNSGARMLFSAGFDSIPSEAGVWSLQEMALERLGKPFPRINGRVRVFDGGIGGGSAASGANTRAAVEKDPSLGAKLMDPFLYTPDNVGPEQPSSMAPEEDPDLGPVLPFHLAMINTKSVHRANMLLGYPWGKEFAYQEMILNTPEAAGAMPDPAAPPPKPGEGPSKERRDSGSHEMVFIGIGEDGEKIKLGVRGEGDPGFRSTSRIIAETALCLIDTPEVQGGMWTPISALKGKLVERLQANADVTIGEETI